VFLLTTAAHPTIMRFRQYPAGRHLGRLLTPRHFSNARATAAAGVPWAADNDGFNGVNFAAFETMLDALAGVPDCLFVTAPDVVAQAGPTLALLGEWSPRIRARRLPVALVLQDGLTDPADVPWHLVDAVFVGGSTAYKLSDEAATIVRAATARGAWAHMGRVNSYRRIAYAREIGCDSFDGTKYARWRDTKLPDGLIAAAGASQGAATRLL
jgi:hypothetical protein